MRIIARSALCGRDGAWQEEAREDAFMPYLRNAWYAAGWSHELADTPLARTILEQPIVFYRGEGGRPLALYDACPHRFAPLSLGKVQGNRIACGYHGLEF